jgi:hypothetical protein
MTKSSLFFTQEIPFWHSFLLIILNDLLSPRVDTIKEEIIILDQRFSNYIKEIWQGKPPELISEGLGYTNSISYWNLQNNHESLSLLERQKEDWPLR